jgi:hypothetical protein
LEENGRVQSRARIVTLDSFAVEEGFCRVAAAPHGAPGDSNGVNCSALRLFEDGLELGPSHSIHADVRRFGRGRFSHWGTDIYFSSSDGFPPESNGRTYQALIPAATDGADILLSQLATIDFEALSVDQRYAAIERLAAVLVPREHLSEIKRSMFLDKEFREDFERFSEGIYRSYDRKFLMREFARLAMEEKGHFAECGVYKGASAYILAKELRKAGSNKKLHLYDSFEGLSAPAYGFETCPGARKAFDDFFKATGDVVLRLPTGQGVVICGLSSAHRNDSASPRSVLAPTTLD